MSEHVLQADAAPTLGRADDGFEQRRSSPALPRHGSAERIDSAGRDERFWRHAQARADVSKKVICERGNVLAAVSERRHVDADHGQPAEQIIADAPFFHRNVER